MSCFGHQPEFVSMENVGCQKPQKLDNRCKYQFTVENWPIKYNLINYDSKRT